MDVMMRRTQTHHSRSPPTIQVDYLEQTAHSVEVRREVNESGEFGSFGFTLIQERPSIVGTIVPGGHADKAGLKKNDVVIAVNSSNTTNCSHQEVVSIIANNPTPSIWLTVCEPSESPRPQLNSRIYESSRTQFSRVQSLGSRSMSQSTPMIPRNIMDPRQMYTNDDSPPKYAEATRSQRASLASTSRALTTSSVNMSPLTKQVFRQSVQNGHQGLQQQRGGSDFTLYSSSPPSPTPSPSAFTSANVLVLYIGPVEIPNTWKVRELSSRCLQECTRQLLSQRQEFLEVFLEVNLRMLKILKVDQGVLFQHPREELYYCGVCTDDEQYFGIVTKKEQKGSKKSSQSNGHQPRAHICHVFKVIQSKSVLILHTGDSKSSPKNSKLLTPVKPKTIPITSCVTIINALQGLFTSDDVGGSKLFSDSSSLRGGSDPSLKVGPSLTSFYSTSSGGSGGSSESVSGPEKSKKKFDVIDLRPTAFTPKSGHSLLTSSVPLTNPNTYVAVNSSHNHTRSLSKDDYPLSIMATPAYHQRQGSGNSSWYAVDSPKEHRHSREGSWDNRDTKSRPISGNYDKYAVQISHGSSGSSGRQSVGIRFDQARKMSDDSSISSLSDSRASSPAKLKSPFHGHSHSPSPPQSLSYSSGSRSRSPSPKRHRSPSPGPIPRAPRYHTPSVSKLSAGLALETTAHRFRPSSPATAFVGSRITMRRQGSESSIMDMQDHMSPYRASLPAKNTALTSSIGSVATLTTVADEDVNDPEECGRVGGWVASFDKLIADPMGVQCLLHFLEKIHCEENILFWRDAQALKSSSPQNFQEAVKKIYDQYLAPTSPNTVNVDDRVLKGVEARLANPPLNIFNEAQDQIYQLMKMDCYPRFKKSDIVKECLMSEMEGKPLPIDPTPQKQQHQTQYNGIWKKHRERGLTRSLFGKRFGRKVQQEQQQQATAVWGVSPEGKSPDSGLKKGNKKGSKDDPSPRSRRSATVRETSRSKQGGGAVEAKAKGSNPDDTTADDFLPEHHLDIFKAHKRNVFEVNLPNKVTKIMQVPDRATVREAIQPVLKKYGYTFEMMELRFANTFKLINLDLSANVLIGQHIIVTKSKNTFIAAFPDVLEKILPADGTKSVGALFVGVLKEMDKLQNFQVYLEGSRVPLELSVDTSVLVGQRVIIKYLPGPCTFKVPEVTIGPTLTLSSKPSKSSLNSSNGSGDMDDLFSKIFRLQGDGLDDQRTSPTPGSTPEPESIPTPPSQGSGRSSSQDDLLRKHSPSDMRKRAQSQGKRTPSTNELSHKMLSVSKSIDVLDHGHHSHYHRDKHSRGDREKRSDRHQKHSSEELRVPNHRSSRTQFKRVQSGSSITNPQKEIVNISNRSLSPPANLGQDALNEYRRRSNTSPPPPSGKPPPLPNNVKRLSGGKATTLPNSRWSATSFKSTDSASSEDSLTADVSRHSKHHHQKHNGIEHTYVNRANAVDQQPQYFPQAYPAGDKKGDGGPIYINGSVQEKARSYQRNRPVNLSSLSTERNPRPSMMPSPPRDDTHPLDNLVTEAYAQRKTSHPLQNTRGQAHTRSGTNLSSYPWHTAHAPQPQRKSSAGPLRSSKERRILTENPELLQAGHNLVQKEIDEYHSHSDLSSNSSTCIRVPLSPTTHTLTVPDDAGCETFV